MITVNISGMEDLYSLIEALDPDAVLEDILDIIDDELMQYAIQLKLDPEIPEEYSNALTSVIIEEMNTVVLLAYFPEEWKKKVEDKRFGTRMEWAIYNCTRRHYFGGKIAKEWTGPNWLRLKWDSYKDKFIMNVRSRIIEMIRSR
jgi:hypothetical protein